MTLHVTRADGPGHITVRAVYGPVRFEITEAQGHLVQFWHELGKLVAVEDNEARAKAGYVRFHESIGGGYDPWEILAPAHRDAWTAAFTE